jgi:hypothetical protein
MTRVDVRGWTFAERVLGAAGLTLLALALERLANAAMKGGAAAISVALGFSVVFGVVGALVVTTVFVMRFVRRTSHQGSDCDSPPANNRKARLG